MLTSVWLDLNYISGSIPTGISELVGLTLLSISTTNVMGSIPESIGRLSNMQELSFFQNNISGGIPSSIGNITGLSVLILMGNMLEGSIPVSLCNCSKLTGLHLAENRLTGGIPEEIGSLSSLSLGLILYQNYLTGPLPSQVGKLVNLVTMAISDNKLSGEIPSTLGNCLMLDSLSMAGNFFQGIIPSELKNLKSAQEIDLSRNNLSGQIPSFLGELSFLGDLNLSFNQFEGEVPSVGIFTNTSLFSVLGNKNLCGGIEQLKFPACPTEKKRHSKLKVTLLATFIPISMIFLGVCVCAFLYRFSRSAQPPSLAASKEENQFPRLTYSDLYKSTNGFSSANLIGEGRYGSVYKGVLDSSEQPVAVKVLNLQESGADKSFLAECEALRTIRHRNLVKIVTSCSSIDFKGHDFKALVFEFMTNGSLESWLHPTLSDQQQDPKSLNLVQRLKVAADVACALDYLHDQCETLIVHCDLKPSNVLLDGDLCAHVGDFGLARILSTTTSTISNHQQSGSTGIRGTMGYVAPEYGMGGNISTQGDMYSFGVLLLEMFIGKRPTDSMFTDDMILHSYAKMSIPDRVMEIIDPRIGLEDEEKAELIGTNQSRTTYYIAKVKVCLVSVLQIGIACSAENPNERMDAKAVVTELHKIRDVFLGVSCGRRELG